MKQTCKLHPTELAHWSCPHCGACFCRACILVREKTIYGSISKQKLHLCPSCIREAEWIGAANALEPFWKRLHKIFLYPFSTHPILLIFCLAGFNMFFSGRTLVSILVQIALWGVLYKYAFAVLKNTAKGNLTPPPLNSQTLSDDFNEAFKQLGIFAAIGFFFVLIARLFGPIVGLIYLIPSLFAFPMMIIVYGGTGSVIQALNPVLVSRMIYRIGWPYLLMFGFLILLSGAPNTLVWSLHKMLPLKLLQFIFFLTNGFYTIVTYHLMGYMLLQFHKEVGYKIDIEDFNLNDQKPVSAEAPGGQNEIHRMIDPLLKDGKYEEALQIFQDHPAEKIAGDPELSGSYFLLLRLTKREEEMVRHGETHLASLVGQNLKGKALNVYRDCVVANPDFLPVPMTLLKLAGWFNEAGDYRNAIQAYNRLITSYPDNPLVPKAYFRAAQIFNDKLKNASKAREIMEAILRKFPASDEASLAGRYVKNISA